MTNIDLSKAIEEANRRYQGDWDAYNQAPVDDMGWAESERRAFIDGARFAVELLGPELDKTKRGAMTLGEIIDRQCIDVLDATGLHHMVNEDGDGDWGAIWDIMRDLCAKGRAKAEDARA